MQVLSGLKMLTEDERTSIATEAAERILSWQISKRKDGVSYQANTEETNQIISNPAALYPQSNHTNLSRLRLFQIRHKTLERLH